MSFTNPEKAKVAIRYWLQGKGYFLALETMEFASQYHTGFRKDGITPEFHHQICIANFVRTLPALRDEELTLACVFLHDTVEDYPVPLSEIERLFGSDVMRSVGLLSKEVLGQKKDPAEYFRAMAEDPIASIVKGADRIHNFQTMVNVFTPAKQEKYIEECEQNILPMLKQARRNFPDQEPAYENLKHVLRSQIGLISHALQAWQGQIERL